MPIDPNRRRDGRVRAAPLTRDEAETLAIQAVAFLAGQEEHFLRFVALTGTTVDTLRESLADAAVLGAVLDFVLADEALLLAFCASAAIAPDRPARARRLLPGAPAEP